MKKSVKKKGLHFYCLKIFAHLGGYHFALLPVLMLLAGIFDSIGIVLFFPLLKSLDMPGSAGDSQLLSFFYKILHMLHIDSIGGILLFISAVFLIKFFITILQGFATQSIIRDIYRQLSSRIVKGWIESDYQNHYLKKSTGYFANIMTTALPLFLKAFSAYCALLVNLCNVTIYLLVSLSLDLRITIIAIITGATIFVLFRFLMHMTRRYSLRTVDDKAKLQSKAVELMEYYKYIKSTALFHKISDQIDRNVRKITSFKFKMDTIGNFSAKIIEPLSVILVLAFIYIQAVVWKNDFAMLTVLMMIFYKALTKIICIPGDWQRFLACSGGVQVIYDALEETAASKESLGEVKISELKRGIEFNDVDFHYAGKQVLFDVSLKIKKNKTVALVGASGSGKSTIVDLLNGLLHPSGGDVVIDGVSYRDVDINTLRQITGYITQEIVMFNDTIGNNISLWDAGDDVPSKILSAAKNAHCMEFIENLPNGLETHVGDRGINLSVGQRQRIAIARELYRRPQILILDEATSALDTKSENLIQQTIEEFKGKMTLVIIAHRLSTVKNADYIYVIDQGKVTEEGSFQDLYGDSGSKFHQMCQLQNFG